MGITEFDVYGKMKFEKEEQFTHLCLVIEASSVSEALSKAKKISNVIKWTHASEHVFED